MIFTEQTILKEKQRIEFMLYEYTKQLEGLPKGTLVSNKKNSKTYFYLKFREGKKVISKYIPGDEVTSLKELIDERHHIEAMIKSLKSELKFVNKALGVKA